MTTSQQRRWFSCPCVAFPSLDGTLALRLSFASRAFLMCESGDDFSSSKTTSCRRWLSCLSPMTPNCEISTEPTEPSRTSSSSSSNKDQPLTSIMKPKGGGRYRSSSFDTSRARSSSNTDALHSHGYFSNSSLGDFHEMGTRRLMTDLILTLNASFPDYDFGSVRPDHFIRERFQRLRPGPVSCLVDASRGG